MKKTRFEQMQDQLMQDLGAEKAQPVVLAMKQEYESLCAQYADRPQAFQKHMHNNIFPVVAAFHALMKQGMERQKASELAQSTFLKLMEAPADMIRRMMKIPGLYRAMPWIWKTAMPKMFGEDAGFKFSFYPTDGRQVKFDMLACPYYQMCQELDCPELGPVFCTTDDICYGHMHPKLIWNRTKTLARGGDCCDFDLYIPKKKRG